MSALDEGRSTRLLLSSGRGGRLKETCHRSTHAAFSLADISSCVQTLHDPERCLQRRRDSPTILDLGQCRPRYQH